MTFPLLFAIGIACAAPASAQNIASLPEAIEEQALNGAIGMKIHEDFGATPQVIKCCLDVADKMDFQVQIQITEKFLAVKIIIHDDS